MLEFAVVSIVIFAQIINTLIDIVSSVGPYSNKCLVNVLLDSLPVTVMGINNLWPVRLFSICLLSFHVILI